MKSLQRSFIFFGIMMLIAMGFIVYDLWDDFAGKSPADLWEGGYLIVLGIIVLPWVLAAIFFSPVLQNIFSPRIPNGVATQARVIQVRDTNITMNKSPLVDLWLEFSTGVSAPIQVKTRAFVSRLDAALVKPGITADILYDPQKPRRVQIVQLHLHNPSAADSATRLEELKQLHSKGLITDEEYRRKRTEILDRL